MAIESGREVMVPSAGLAIRGRERVVYLKRSPTSTSPCSKDW